MIYNLKYHSAFMDKVEAKLQHKYLTFTVITEIGQCDVRVDLDDLTIEKKQPKMFIDNYVILGTVWETGTNIHSQWMIDGLKTFEHSLRTIEKNNNWCLWSY